MQVQTSESFDGKMGTSSTKQEVADEIKDQSLTENNIDQSWSFINLHLSSYLSGVLTIMLVILLAAGILCCLISIRRKWIRKQYKNKHKHITHPPATPLSLEMPAITLQSALDSTCRTVAQSNQPLQIPLMYGERVNVRSITSSDQCSQVP